ncbi:uncharacterized protein PITG_10125 [Phytophthora infestans T30-4]|uniref:Transmembrane protein, putative n=2 Tax=Phytophthora infestans TaxID=4787 RepID=D0NED3_PHYIT|nr:uncharacterized protein PITG_10125 [Phytophthora infestans T30-4]EEY56578.1 transmembrane protein, putative [Phytophthora infestans T30-4]KAF4042465.1 hypothetical protein GN244_ATG05173 [Phytophthora infestans]KAF4150547.1 hypothetical protein GN958_ATG00209 [Phytophthora infestans]|eukprot:XP_002902652.1 transmembrane protein, putative [Phytophthora infestans T30-4]
MNLPAFARVAALLTLYGLDLLDLHAKLAWIGSSESFSFDIVYEHGFEYDPLPRPAFLNTNKSLPTTELGTELLRGSGWTSLYERCRDLYATKDSEAFDVIKATDCELRPHFSAERHVALELILSATLSVDSVAWVSCQLLFFHRRPPLCQDNVVTLFAQRYRLAEDEVHPDKMAPINSVAEAELLRMLHLLSRSHPLSNVICAQGFEATAGPGHYDADVFVCGSPNVFESAFIGVFASSFAELHADLAQLAVDKVDIMGLELLTRQNSRSQFVLKEKDDDIVVMEENKTNFATFGHLYVVLVFVDMTLLLVHVRAIFDTVRMFGWKKLVGFNDSGNDESDNFSDSRWLLLYRSLYRSGPIAGLTMASALISWLVNLPFALMWCRASKGQVYALVSAVRVWMLVLCLLNLLWSVFVRMREARAYSVVKGTFVTSLEILAASAFVVFLKMDTLFDVAMRRRQLEGQQGLDNESFPGHTALWNAYNPEVDGFATTPPQIVHALFAPLAVVVTQSLALLVVVLVAKYVYYRRLQARQESDAANAVAVVDFDNIDEHLTCPSTDHRTSKAPLISRGHVKNYSRLPLEELLRTPARANSLVRCHFDIDVVEDDGLAYMPPHVYYAFGVLVTDAGFLRTRRGFPTVIHRRIDVEKFFAPSEKSSTVSPSPLKRQQHPSTRIKFALKNVPTTGEAESENHSPSPPRTLSEFKSMPMAKSMRRRKSMEELLKSPSSSP